MWLLGERSLSWKSGALGFLTQKLTVYLCNIPLSLPGAQMVWDKTNDSLTIPWVMMRIMRVQKSECFEKGMLEQKYVMVEDAADWVTVGESQRQTSSARAKRWGTAGIWASSLMLFSGFCLNCQVNYYNTLCLQLIWHLVPESLFTFLKASQVETSAKKICPSFLPMSKCSFFSSLGIWLRELWI